MTWGLGIIADLFLPGLRLRLTSYSVGTAVRLEPKQLAELEKIAKHQDRTIAYIIRKAIDEYVRKVKP